MQPDRTMNGIENQTRKISLYETTPSSDFFAYLRDKVSIQMLLSDREGQATLARLLAHYVTRDKQFAEKVHKLGESS